MADELKATGTPFYRHGDILHSRGEELEREIFMRGETAGRLAVALDTLTDALVLVGQHGVYCTSNRNPAVPKLDLQAVLAGIGGAKELIAGAMDHLRKQKEAH
ncbi:MAG TPA: hypothetical protein VGU25_15515 [Acidobacteriaceae bacterium]|nr:hypothetical protein [Acidobacteriaceae bacterium]